MTHSLKQQLSQALDQDKQENWDDAHHIVQSIKHRLAYWIHAYLHRKEGDNNNASYWYQRANMKAFNGDLLSEREAILKEINDSFPT